MAKINAMGKAVVVTSDITKEQYELLQKYNPDALVLKGGEDGKEVVFRVAFHDGGKPGMSAGVAVFNGVNKDGKLTATSTVPFDVSADPGQVADLIGPAIANLDKVEKGVEAAADKVKADRKALIDRITIA